MQELNIMVVYETLNIAEILEMADREACGEKQSELQEVFKVRVSVAENPDSSGEWELFWQFKEF